MVVEHLNGQLSAGVEVGLPHGPYSDQAKLNSQQGYWQMHQSEVGVAVVAEARQV